MFIPCMYIPSDAQLKLGMVTRRGRLKFSRSSWDPDPTGGAPMALCMGSSIWVHMCMLIPIDVYNHQISDDNPLHGRGRSVENRPLFAHTRAELQRDRRVGIAQPLSKEHMF